MGVKNDICMILKPKRCCMINALLEVRDCMRNVQIEVRLSYYLEH